MKNNFIKSIFSLLIITVVFNCTKAQTIEYGIVYNTAHCKYEAHAYVIEGERTFPNTIPFPSSFSIVVPAALEDVPIVVTENVNPPNMMWDNLNSIYQPEADAQHDFHAFTISGGSGSNSFLNLDEGADIHLFSFEIPIHLCDEGIRPFSNEADPGSAAPGMELIDFSQSFKVFPDVDLYRENNSNTTTAAPALEPAVSCTPTEITLTANPRTNCQALSFQWSGPDNFSANSEVAVISVAENPAAQSGTYTVIVTDESGCSAQRTIEVAGANCLSSLPVKLLAFQGEAMDDHNLISWSTESEFKNLFFEVERSVDAINFEAFAKVDGNPYSNEKQHYEVKDEEPFNVTYYRLKQVDLDGKFAYADVIEISRKAGAMQILDIYPNPVMDELSLVYEVPAQMTTKVTISDAIGEVLFNTNLTNKAGLNTEVFDTRNLTPGIYFIKIKNDAEEVVSRFVVK